MRSATVLTLLSLLGGLEAVHACQDVNDVIITFYGYPDNSPPGPGTAYNCGGRNYVAGGTGSYDDPLTMASAAGEWNKCETIYVPYLRKYVRYEDECAKCTKQYNNSGKLHIDIWTGSSTINGGQPQIQCEDDLTPTSSSNGIVRYPATSYHTNTNALWVNGASTPCGTADIYPHNLNTNYC